MQELQPRGYQVGRGQASAQPCGAAEKTDFTSIQPLHVPEASRAVGDDETCRTQVLLLSP